MIEKTTKIRNDFQSRIASVTGLADLESVHQDFLGKKGILEK